MGASTAANLRLNGRGIPSQVSAIALLVSQRGYATEQSTSSSSDNLPPPGFNAEQAKKPLSPEAAQRASANTTQQVTTKGESAITNTNNTGEVAVAKSAEDEKKAGEEKKEQKKLTIGQKIKKEAQHYWDGTKLLATEVKISSRLALKMAGGYELSRREQRQVSELPRVWLVGHKC